ncbi:MAG: hypothetical protein ABI217_12370, partial [Chthoniobacterales bacterium]
IEICENQGINQQAANDRAARLTALQLHELGIPLEGNVVQHHDWTGKNCPALLRGTPDGWTDFLQMVSDYYSKTLEAPPENNHAAPLDLFVAKDVEESKDGTLAQNGILSTEFGGGAETGMRSAYGGTIDPNEPQASLPARLPRSKRQIQVSNPSSGRSVICLVNDVGPWNIHDSYWEHGSRPAAEAQFENHQVAEDRHVPSNRAGLDLTPAAMLALGVSGAVNTRQVTVNWQFV